jgi:hypothetical protein
MNLSALANASSLSRRGRRALREAQITDHAGGSECASTARLAKLASRRQSRDERRL